MISVLFVCSTNTSLSPLAAEIFRRLVTDAGLDTHFSSAGAGSHPGNSPRPIDRLTRQVAERNGVVLPEQQSRQVTAADIKGSTVIICMNEENFWSVHSLAELSKLDLPPMKLRLLMEYSGQLGLRELPEPLFGEISYDEAYDKLRRILPRVLAELCRQFELPLDHLPKTTDNSPW